MPSRDDHRPGALWAADPRSRWTAHAKAAQTRLEREERRERAAVRHLAKQTGYLRDLFPGLPEDEAARIPWPTPSRSAPIGSDGAEPSATPRSWISRSGRISGTGTTTTTRSWRKARIARTPATPCATKWRGLRAMAPSPLINT